MRFSGLGWKKMVDGLRIHHGNLCWLCKQPLSDCDNPNCLFRTTIDHLVPVSKGGCDEPWNLRLAHGVCNVARGNSIDPEEIEALVMARLKNGPFVAGYRKIQKPNASLISKKKPFLPKVNKPKLQKQISPMRMKLIKPDVHHTWTFFVNGERMQGDISY